MCLKVQLRLSRKAASLEEVGLLIMLRGDQCDVHPPPKLLEQCLFKRKLVSVNSGVRCWIKTIECLLAESGQGTCSKSIQPERMSRQKTATKRSHFCCSYKRSFCSKSIYRSSEGAAHLLLLQPHHYLSKRNKCVLRCALHRCLLHVSSSLSLFFFPPRASLWLRSY